MSFAVRQSPHEVYRRVDFDARVAGADARELVSLCCEQLSESLGTAIHAHRAGDHLLRSRSLTRAISAATALQIGVSGEDAMARTLHDLYGATRRALLDSVPDFDTVRLAGIRDDFREIGSAMRSLA